MDRTTALDRALEELIGGRGGGIDDDEVDIDKRVAELIVQEAREKNEGSKRRDRSKRHMTNTRFLNNVVRGVQSHNRAILNTSSPPAQDRQDILASPHRMGTSSRQAEARDRRGTQHGRLRGWSDDEEKGRWEDFPRSDRGHGDRARSKEEERGKRKQSHESLEEEEERRRERRRYRRREEESKKRGSMSPDSRRRQNSSDDRSSRSGRHSHCRRNDDDNNTTSDSRVALPTSSSNRQSSSSHKEASPASKMDRYFAKNYDPMLDVKAEVRQDSSGLVEDDGWDRMLQALRDKEERKRARKSGESSRSEGRSRRRPATTDEDEGQKKSGKVGTSLFDTHYTSRGGLREWDRGKESSG